MFEDCIKCLGPRLIVEEEGLEQEEEEQGEERIRRRRIWRRSWVRVPCLRISFVHALPNSSVLSSTHLSVGSLLLSYLPLSSLNCIIGALCSVGFPQSPSSTVAVAIGQGFTVVFLMLMFGHISGAHFNPAITLGVWIAGGIRFVLVVFYFIFQLFGAFIGALLVRVSFLLHPFLSASSLAASL